MFKRDEPYFLSIGVSYNDYWYGDTGIALAYQKADEYRQRRENAFAWLQGLYITRALDATVGNALRGKHDQASRYPERPFETGEAHDPVLRDQQKAEEAVRIDKQMDMLVQAFSRHGANK